MRTVNLKSYRPHQLLYLVLIILFLGNATGTSFAANLPGQSRYLSSNNQPATLLAASPVTQTAQLLPSDGAASDLFGTRVALSSDGNTALVGAYAKQVGTNIDEGEAYVYSRAGAGSPWVQQATIWAADGAAYDYFGWSVALSADGNTALIGAYNKKVGFNDQEGEASIFSRTGSFWFQTSTLSNPDGEANDHFSRSVALSADGKTALIGAPDKNTDSNLGPGIVYVFSYADNMWNQSDSLTPADGVPGDQFGNDLALSGDGTTALIGAPGKTVGSDNYAGEAYFFTNAGSGWSEQSNLTNCA